MITLNFPRYPLVVLNDSSMLSARSGAQTSTTSKEVIELSKVIDKGMPLVIIIKMKDVSIFVITSLNKVVIMTLASIIN